MKIDLINVEFDMNEFVALLFQDKQEGFRRIGEKFLNAVLKKSLVNILELRNMREPESWKIIVMDIKSED